MRSPIFNSRLGIYMPQHNSRFTDVEFARSSLPSSSEYNSSLRFHQFLSERLCVGWFFLCTDTRINFHWSIAFQSSSPSPSGLHPSRPSFFFPLYLFPLLAHFFLHPPLLASASVCHLSLFPCPTVVLSRRWFPRKERRRSEKDADRRCTNVRVCIAVRSRLSLPARAIPRFAAGPWETAHLPSFRWNGQTTAEQRGFASLPPPFARQQPCGLLHLAASFSSNDTVLP